MIERLDIEGYRGFEKLTLEGVARVNLLVGKNNAGKTSVLEAVRLLASGEALQTLVEISKQRGEVSRLEAAPEHPADQTLVDLGHFFHGRNPGAGSTFRIEAGSGTTAFEVELKDKRTAPADDLPDVADLFVRGAILLLRWPRQEGGMEERAVLSTTPGGVIRVNRDQWQDLRYSGRVTLADRPKQLLHLSAAGLSTRTLIDLWSARVIDGQEAEVSRALRVVDPTVHDLDSLGGLGLTEDGGFVVGFKGGGSRVPLGSLGDGMHRMLALSLALASARGGYLLVDEIDTGLHWSVMADMWRLVMKAAADNDVQVFATTHSQDCLRALAEAVEQDAGELFASPEDEPVVFRIEKDRAVAPRYDAGMLQYAVEAELEVRG